LPQPSSAEEPYQVEWVRQFGSDSTDRGYGVAVDASGFIYLTGETYGNLGNPNLGFDDIFVRKYDQDGGLLWSEQLGTEDRDHGNGITVDAQGGIYIAGRTSGSLVPGNSGIDLVVAKYDPDGSRLWTEQYGPGQVYLGEGISADGQGGIYITGRSGPNALLTKYDTEGTQLWARDLSLGYLTRGQGVSADSLGNVFITGVIEGMQTDPDFLGPHDLFVAKYDAAGELQWTREIDDGEYDFAYATAADGVGNVYVSGVVHNPAEALLAKYDADGNLLWRETLAGMGPIFGTSSFGVAVDAFGNAYIAGSTSGDLAAPHAGGFSDVFVAKYAADGERLWEQQFGSDGTDIANAIAIDSLGNLFVTGETSGDFGGPDAGGIRDVFVAKLSPVPEPATILLALVGAAAVAVPRIRRRRFPNLSGKALACRCGPKRPAG
jgi:hypothetical protein